MKKKLCLILALLMLVPAFASCSDKGSNNDDNSNISDNSGNGGSDSSNGNNDETEDDKSYKANIPEGTALGKTFTVAAYPNDGSIWGDVDWSAEEMTGEVINDAVYERTLYVESLLDVDIKTEYLAGGGDTAAIINVVSSGLDSYQLANINIGGSFQLAQRNNIHELNSFAEKGTLDLKAPWWDPNIISDLSVANRNFCLTGDIGTMYKKSIGVIMFNKSILANAQLENPYELMENKNWTLDKMIEMGSQISDDLDGNGKMDGNDRYGLITFCNMMSIAFIGCDVEFSTKDDRGVPVISFYSDKAIGVMEKLGELMYNTDLTWSWSIATPGDEQPAFKMFQQDQSLFYYGELHAVATMREMNSPFGILPMPLYESTQERYYHCVNPDVAAVYVIPTTNLDYTGTGYVMDALGAASKNLLTPAYYNQTLIGKVSRDEESTKSLDIIINTIRYDLGYLGGVGVSSMLHGMADARSTELTSKWKSQERVVTRVLENMTKKLSSAE